MLASRLLRPAVTRAVMGGSTRGLLRASANRIAAPTAMRVFSSKSTQQLREVCETLLNELEEEIADEEAESQAPSAEADGREAKKAKELLAESEFAATTSPDGTIVFEYTGKNGPFDVTVKVNVNDLTYPDNGDDDDEDEEEEEENNTEEEDEDEEDDHFISLEAEIVVKSRKTPSLPVLVLNGHFEMDHYLGEDGVASTAFFDVEKSATRPGKFTAWQVETNLMPFSMQASLEAWVAEVLLNQRACAAITQFAVDKETEAYVMWLNNFAALVKSGMPEAGKSGGRKTTA
jgi:hypothetical protein